MSRTRINRGKPPERIEGPDCAGRSDVADSEEIATVTSTPNVEAAQAPPRMRRDNTAIRSDPRPAGRLRLSRAREETQGEEVVLPAVPTRRRRTLRGLAAHRDDARTPMRPGGADTAKVEARDDADVVRIEEPESHIVVVAFGREAWPQAEAELIGLARFLAGPREAIVLCRIGASERDAGRAGADRLVTFDNAGILQRRSALAALCGDLKPRHVLLPSSDAGNDLARFLAAWSGVRPAIGIVQLRGNEVLVPAADRQHDYARPLPPVATFTASACKATTQVARREARKLIVQGVTSDPAGITDDGIETADVSRLALEEAEFVVSAGGGVRDLTLFGAVARSLSATIGASRVVCDAGALPRDRQVGASGHVTRAQAYVAFGISGASQHLEGIRDCAHVVAVNTDPHAAMLARADLAIVADAGAVLAALLENGESARG